MLKYLKVIVLGFAVVVLSGCSEKDSSATSIMPVQSSDTNTTMPTDGNTTDNNTSSPSDNNSSDDVQDITPPVITILGDSTVSLAEGSEYTDAGATAIDDRDGNITANIVTTSDVDISTVGTYTLTYDVNDTAGNAATQVIRTVKVVDTQAPTITLNGDKNVTLNLNETYSELGANITDNYDKNLTVSISGSVDVSKVGTYTLTYDVNDTAGNAATQVIRTVTVIDPNAPIITLKGEAIVTVVKGNTYSDAGATATDEEDGDLTNSIMVSNTVDTSNAGTYIVTYDVNDSAGNSAQQVTRTVIVEDAIVVNKENQVIPIVVEGAKLNTKINITSNEPKDLYILFTNYDDLNASTPTVSHGAKVVATKVQNKRVAKQAQKPKIEHAPAYIGKFNRNAYMLLKENNESANVTAKRAKVAAKVVAEGDNNVFYLKASSTDNNTTATLKKAITDISTIYGNKTLYIWVSDDVYGAGCPKKQCIEQADIDALASTFLKAGEKNDIYDWVTNVYGEEWGSEPSGKYTNLIPESNEITILLTDIGNDNSDNGGTMGYFWSKDNLTQSTVAGSNERIMFYIDAVMFANDGEGDWKKETYSTLAHEFQHMIQYYQKQYKYDGESGGIDTWIDEMLAETTEDLVATKLEHKGPRGVAHDDGTAGDPDNYNGRYPLFTENINTRSLSNWSTSDSLPDYSKVSAFGTFLLRNYGGAKVLRDIMHNKYIHEDAVMDAIHKVAGSEDKELGDIIKEWGVAVMLSDTVNATPSYNTGNFKIDDLNGTEYKLGSINFFNYDPQPAIASTIGEVKEHGNYYYEIGKNITGVIDLNLSLGSDVEATLIAK